MLNDSHDLPAEDLWMNRFNDVINLCTSLYWQHDRDDFFNRIAQHVKKMAQADVVNIRLLSSTQDSFITYVTSGDIDPELLGQYSVLSVHTGRMPYLMRTLEPIVFDFANPHTNDVNWLRGSEDGFHTAITLPLANEGTVSGVCDLLYHSNPNFGESDLEWLQSIGRLIGVIISNSLLAEAQISMRINDERNRISSEIHDNLSQSINLIAFEAGNMGQSLREGDLSLLKSELDRLSVASDQAVKLIRNEISQLHASDKPENGLKTDRIVNHVKDFAVQWGLGFETELTGRYREITIPDRIGMQLMRIVNEAITNTVRHSGATTIKMQVYEDNNSLAINLIDNGCGFNTHDVCKDHIGIKSMKERARSVGGDVSVTSQEYAGTQVSIFLPHLV